VKEGTTPGIRGTRRWDGKDANRVNTANDSSNTLAILMLAMTSLAIIGLPLPLPLPPLLPAVVV
jgi:hypothetical protein